jgi:hypothetical protein
VFYTYFIDFFPEDDSKRIETCRSFKVLIAKLYISVSCIQLVIVSKNECCIAVNLSPSRAERMDGAVPLLPLYVFKACTRKVLPLPVTALLSNCGF